MLTLALFDQAYARRRFRTRPREESSTQDVVGLAYGEKTPKSAVDRQAR